jgi:hypothetical protein
LKALIGKPGLTFGSGDYPFGVPGACVPIAIN